jgi:hypothetical protein
MSIWSGREDLNLRLPAPKAGALPGCATPRCIPMYHVCLFDARWSRKASAYKEHAQTAVAAGTKDCYTHNNLDALGL